MQIIRFLAFYGTIFEVMLILMIVLSVIAVKVLAYYSQKNRAKLIEEIKVFLRKNMRLNIQVHSESFKPNWKKLDVLLLIVNSFDKTEEANIWAQIRINFIRNILLPLARSEAYSPDWRKRHYASLAFTLYATNSDEKYILKLLNDTIPLVRYSTAGAAIKFGSEAAIETAIRQMSKESWLTQYVYMQGFDEVPYATHYILERILKNSKEPAIRATTYNLLMRYSIFDIDWDVTVDVHSENKLLSLTAMRFMTFSQKDKVEPILIKTLQNTDWKERSLALACLGDLKRESNISDISSRLNDENWWVRLAAEQALRKLGERGKNELSRLNIKSDGMMIDIPQHVLDTF